MRRFAVLIVVALAAGGPAAADTAEQANASPPRRLALAETLQTAVRQNPALARATIDMEVAKATALESLGLDDWILTGTGNWSSTRKEPVAGNPYQLTGTDRYLITAGIERSLSTGGLLSIDASASRSDTDFLLEVTDEDTGNTVTLPSSSRAYSAALNVSFYQPLLRGRGSEVARAAQRQAAVARDIATLQRESAALDVVRDIVTAYWELTYAAREVEIRKGSLELAEEQLRITRAGIEAGATAPTEALAVEQGILVREEAILLAEIAVSERSLELRRLVGLEVGPGEIDIETSEPPNVAEADYELDAALARALERSPTLAILAKRGESATIDVVVTENGLKPRLDLTASAGPDASADRISETTSQIAKLESYSVSAGLSYRQALGNRAARGAHDRAIHEERRIRVNLAEAERETSVAVVRAVNLLRSARKRIEVTRKSIELAEQNLKNERARFEAGDATNFDILRRQEEIEQAQLGHERAIVDYLQARALVDSLTADLLDRYGIQIAEGTDF